MGITTEEARENALTHLSQSLGLTRDKVENGLCEALRWKDGCGSRFYDTIGSDQLVYLIDDKDHLRAFSITGREVDVHLPAWDRRAEGFPAGVMRWWEKGWIKRWSHVLDDMLILTKNNN